MATQAETGRGDGCLAGGGEMGRLMRARDWSATPVGPVEGWPQSLKTVVQLLLNSRYPMFLWWGPAFTYFYNDAYIPTLGGRHPDALGRSAPEVWAEVWGTLGPMAEAVLEEGRSTWNEELLLFLERSGYSEETYHTFSYSPVANDRGGVGGVFCAVTEDTPRVLGRRRLRTLRELAARTTGARTAEEACRAAQEPLAGNPQDLPFSLIYLADADGKAARLAGVTGLTEGSPACPGRIDLAPPGGAAAPWPLGRVAATGRPERVDRLDEAAVGALPRGVWPEPPRSAHVMPLMHSGQDRPAGFLVAGLSPRKAFDEDYRDFLDLLAGQAATAIANAHAYEEERKRAESLAELDRAKTAFFSNVSHEFRTPLTLMLGPVEEMLAGHDRPGPADREALVLVHRNALRLQKLVNSLLDFSRIEAGRVRAVYEPVDLGTLTAELGSNFRSACEKAGLDLRIDCPPLPVPVYVDRDLWEKVVLNLVSNAFKYTLEGFIEVSLLRRGDEAVLSVRDSGTGIPGRELPRLFERFHRIEGAVGRTQEGTGIGLALVKELVHLQGGQVRVESEAGAGSVFTVTVPLGKAHLPADRVGIPRSAASTALGAAPYVEEALRWLPDAADEKDPAAGPDEGPARDRPPPGSPASLRARVLLTDDNADMRDYVRRLLAPAYDVEVARDGRGALAAVRERRPDLILSDVMMPGLDGFGLLRTLRSDFRTRDIPLILLSARAGEEARLEGLEAGADDYVTKPFGARELVARVGACLQLAAFRREAEAALRESRERLRAALSASGTGTFRWDIPTGALDWDENLDRLFGLPPGQTVRTQDAFLRAVHPEDRPGVRERCERCARDGSDFEMDFRVVWPDGSVHWLADRGRAYRDDDGRPHYLAGACLDITERKRAERHQQALVEIGRSVLVSTDPEGTLRDVVDSVGVHLGASRCAYAEIDDARGVATVHRDYCAGVPSHAGTHPLAAFGPGPLSALRRGSTLAVDDTATDPLTAPTYESAFAPMRVRSFLAVPLIKDGAWVALLSVHQDAPRHWADDEVRLLEAVAERTWFVVENGRLYQELREADRRKDEFLATLAHELRNPLAPIRNALHLMSQAGAGDPGLEPDRAMAERQVIHLARLIDDLMDVARISRGKIELHKGVVDLATVVRQAVETARTQIDDRRHALTVSLPEQPVRLEADPTRLEQVLWNLLNNAAKYTDPGGHIRLEAAAEGGEVVLRVRDTGIGMKPEVLTRVFDMFVQIGDHKDHSQGGLGIGLSLVRTLVGMHGGSISAHSAGPGRGSEFAVRLPVLPPAHEAHLPASGKRREPGGNPPRRRVLVVDDNVDAAKSLARVLTRLHGQEVRVVHDGFAALATAGEFRPEVILLDIGLPGMDGYEVATRLRQRPEFGRTLIAALTGWGQESDVARSRASGIDHHLVKPANPEAIRDLLAGSRPQPD